MREYAAPLRLERRDCRPAALWHEAGEELAPERAGRDADLREGAGADGWECPADPFFLRLDKC